MRRPAALVRYIAKKGWRRLREGRLFAPLASRFEPPPPIEGRIDVRDLIASATLEEHLGRADRYFRSLEDWTWHLAKPLSSPADAPQLLMHFGAVLQGMRLAAGMRVLDFGAGTGWTSHWLSQMGCEVVCCDVSPIALDIAKELYEDHPPFGDTPAPEFLIFDGRRFDLPDESVDRILCFDAFHHAPNPDEVLSEMARVLREGGIAAFSEPGPFHSQTADSQREMKAYGVIENDVDIRAIRRTALRVGFTSMTLSAFFFGPHHVSLEAYEEIERGGAEYINWAEQGRLHAANKRMFFLAKGEMKRDSRQAEGLAGIVRVVNRNAAVAGEPLRLELEVVNSGEVEWLPSGVRPGGVSVGAHLTAADGSERAHDWVWTDLTSDKRTIAPGERVRVVMETPPLRAGSWIIEIGLVSDRVAWFQQIGSEDVRIDVTV